MPACSPLDGRVALRRAAARADFVASLEAPSAPPQPALLPTSSAMQLPCSPPPNTYL